MPSSVCVQLDTLSPSSITSHPAAVPMRQPQAAYTDTRIDSQMVRQTDTLKGRRSDSQTNMYTPHKHSSHRFIEHRPEICLESDTRQVRSEVG